jgi:hypothetical protein
MSLTAAAFVAEAARHEGYREQADGGSTFGEWYGNRHGSVYDNAAWCDMFLAWTAYKVGGEAGLDIIGEFAYTPDHAKWFARNGRWSSKPKAGAIVFYDWSGGKSLDAIDHVGVVTGTASGGRIATIEGNTGTPGHVGAVIRQPKGIVVGYGLPRYTAKSSVTPVKPGSATKAPAFPLAASDWYGTANGKGSHNGTTAKDRPNVELIQQRLKARGWVIVVDGKYGPDTEHIVTQFQTEKGLVPDGAVGRLTWPELWTAPIT